MNMDPKTDHPFSMSAVKERLRIFKRLEFIYINNNKNAFLWRFADRAASQYNLSN